MTQDNNQKQSSTEELAENLSFAITTGAKVFFWLWSLVIGIIALGMFFSNMRIPAIFMMIPALFCNPSFLQYAFNEAAKEGNRPPSILLIFFLAFVFFCGSIGLAVYQAGSEQPTNTAQQINQSKKWYEGGDLHTKNAIAWQNASYQNKLATCADLVAIMWQKNLIKENIRSQFSSSSEALRPLSEELLKALDKAFEKADTEEKNRVLYTNQKVNETAVLLATMMGWL